jgi:hypothetical protein
MQKLKNITSCTLSLILALSLLTACSTNANGHIQKSQEGTVPSVNNQSKIASQVDLIETEVVIPERAKAASVALALTAKVPYVEAYLKILNDNKTLLSKSDYITHDENVVIRNIIGNSTPELLLSESDGMKASLSIWTFDGSAKQLLNSAEVWYAAGYGEFSIYEKNGVLYTVAGNGDESEYYTKRLKYEYQNGQYLPTETLISNYHCTFDDDYNVIDEQTIFELNDSVILEAEYTRLAAETDNAVLLFVGGESGYNNSEAMNYEAAVAFLNKATQGIVATPTSARVLVNGKSVEFDAYTINSQTYYQIADIALQLAGTSKQFSAAWDSSRGAIALTRNSAQTGIMAAKGTTVREATPTKAKIYLDGKEIALTAYTISGHTYYQLKEIGQTFNFALGWDGATSTITIDTSKGYAPNTAETDTHYWEKKYASVLEATKQAINNYVAYINDINEDNDIDDSQLFEDDMVGWTGIQESNMGAEYEGIPLIEYYKYAFKDINNDGVNELFLGGGWYINAIYTIANDKPILLGEFWSRSSARLGQSDIIYNSASGGAAYWYNTKFRISDDCMRLDTVAELNWLEDEKTLNGKVISDDEFYSELETWESDSSSDLTFITLSEYAS